MFYYGSGLVSWCFLRELPLCVAVVRLGYLRLFAFCDKDRSGTLDWKEFKHLVRDTLAVPQEAVAKLEALRAGNWLLRRFKSVGEHRITVKEPFPTRD